MHQARVPWGFLGPVSDDSLLCTPMEKHTCHTASIADYQALQDSMGPANTRLCIRGVLTTQPTLSASQVYNHKGATPRVTTAMHGLWQPITPTFAHTLVHDPGAVKFSGKFPKRDQNLHTQWFHDATKLRAETSHPFTPQIFASTTSRRNFAPKLRGFLLWGCLQRFRMTRQDGPCAVAQKATTLMSAHCGCPPLYRWQLTPVATPSPDVGTWVDLSEQSAERGKESKTPTSRYGKRVSQNSMQKISL